MNRLLLASRIGQGGAVILLAAGLVQAVAGYGIPEWTGDKLAHASLGLLTVGLALIAGLAAARQRDSHLSVLARAACAAAQLGPGLLSLTTVGRLAYLPAALLGVAGVLTVHDWRDTGAALLDEWDRVLLTVLGLCELLLVAEAPVRLMVVGAVGGAALVVAAWWRSAPRVVRLNLAALGTLPIVALGWTAVVPVLLAGVAWLLVLPLTTPTRRISHDTTQP